jgi:hypothetical protein
MTEHVHVPIKLFVPTEVVEFLKEETERRNAAATTDDGQPWTWKQLAWVRCSIMLEEWVREQKFRRSQEQSRQAAAGFEVSEPTAIPPGPGGKGGTA